MASIVPVARAIYLCDYHVGYSNGKVDLYGLFKAIQADCYPHEADSFVCFAQLIGGLGDVSVHIDIRSASDRNVIACTNVRTLSFPDRESLVHLAWTLPPCTFAQPGLYLIELYCNNTWITDTTLELREVNDEF